jgi:hypothetical protein
LQDFRRFQPRELRQSLRFAHHAAGLSKSHLDKPLDHQALQVLEKSDASFYQQSGEFYPQLTGNSAAQFPKSGRYKPPINGSILQ